ncbi:FRG domain-containing protein [Vibrio parahaemolyticus]|nr:FRG domain-containing protein [Vibrio parahaemolyticus]EGR0910610.1 FRG domain-containing protein [Vibrio parahaemolyticus]EGR5930856.1 FRG domain-containing protein [Vibrio parahaemolyticus]EGV3808147.1 FRG domain-containing protein [Vibrio parahaemolyticus]EHZ2575495.1 FRG domain-containing protein [Vibrio parahaemolyticus]
MKSEYYKEIPILNWDTFKKYISDLDSQWVFRGQRCAEWGLMTSIERDLAGVDPSTFEMQIVEKFQQRAPHYIKYGTHPQGIVEWLALMQHHGAPTRLLDWTFSPYVAAYFALESASDDCAIWAIDYSWLRTKTIVKIMESNITNFQDREGMVTDTWFSKLDFYDLMFNRREKMVIPLVPERLNERQIIQQGLFLFGSHRQYTFESNLEAYEEQELSKRFYKFVLDKKVRNEALREQSLMNISAATLFPGLDGLSKSLSIETQLLSEDIHRNSTEDEY